MAGEVRRGDGMSRRKVAGVASGTLIVTVTTAMVVLGVVAPSANAAGQAKVTICHATSSAKNPYTVITVAVSAVDGSRANDHSSHPNDIIPPVGGRPGQNWDARGQAVLAAGCSIAVLADTDRDGQRDVLDPDDDNDGIPDAQDPDDDGDGISDDKDPDQGLKADTDDDGVPDARDSDDDGDGLRDQFDADDDGDGIPDVADPDRPGSTDSDNDCIVDRDDIDDNNDGSFEAEVIEDAEVRVFVAQAGACTPTDADRDGITDSADPDDNNDGKPDRYTTDADRDGVPDYRDPDDDGDGIPDSRDADDDGDGVVEVVTQISTVLVAPVVEAVDGQAVLLREAVLTDAGQLAAVTISCRVTSNLRIALRQAPMDADGPTVVAGSAAKSCRITRSAGNWVAKVTPGTQAVATIRFRAPAVGDRLPLDIVQRVRITG